MIREVDEEKDKGLGRKEWHENGNGVWLLQEEWRRGAWGGIDEMESTRMSLKHGKSSRSLGHSKGLDCSENGSDGGYRELEEMARELRTGGDGEGIEI
ncbi:unnamed protein product [Calypogeia fissa]